MTNAPDPTKFATAFEVGGKYLDHGEDAFSGKAMVNVPVGDTAALRVSGYYGQVPGTSTILTSARTMSITATVRACARRSSGTSPTTSLSA